jgi:drug/metabolite transporter (DMT)-like permease
VLIWGSTWAAIRVSVMHMPVFRSVALRFLIAAAILLVVVFIRRPRLPTRSEWRLLFFFSALTVVMPFSMVAWAQSRTTSGTTSVLFAGTPLLVAVLEQRMLRNLSRLSLPIMLGLAGATIGIAMVLYSAFYSSRTQLSGMLAVLFVVVFGSFSSILAKQRLSYIPPLTTTTFTCLIAGIIVGLLSLLLDRDIPTQWDSSAIQSILFLGVCSSAVGNLLFYWLLVRIRPYQLASRYFLMPLVALVEGWYLLNETITVPMMTGIFLILVSIMPVLRSERQTVPSSEQNSNDL